MANPFHNPIARIEQWFTQHDWQPFAFQHRTWQAYLQGGSGLVHAPTGTGKTYAAWMGPIIEAMSAADDAVTASASALQHAPPPLRVLWLTLMRALANDTVESLRAPIAELGLPWSVELRTGDTSQSVRARQKQQLPTALVTTPESLSVLLSQTDALEKFAQLQCIIVDEWHELMSTKRGVQAELGLAAVRAMAPQARTWALSATLGNLPQARDTLLGPNADSQHVHLIHDDSPKRVEIHTLLPESVERFPWAGHLGVRMLPAVIEAIEQAQSTLVFTNTRSQTEIWFQSLLRARPDWIGAIALHHGSLDRQVRTEVENLLRAGRLRAVVCTSSLDLGVDFSPVDQVVQIGSPKGIARLLQRAGRSGHQPGAVSRIIGVPTNALELLEFAAARDALERRDVEPRLPLDRPLDVLVQHMATRAAGGGFDADALLREVRATHAYAALSDEQWQWCMDFLERGGQTLHAYPEYQRITKRHGRYVISTPQIARRHRMNIGTITSDAAVQIKLANGRLLGTMEESFISRLRPGDCFTFAGRVLELVQFRQMVAQVKVARKPRATVPRWAGGHSPLSHQLADAVRSRIDQARAGKYESPEMRTIRPLLQLQAEWSMLPAPDELLIEYTTTQDGCHAFVFPLDGRLVHEGLATLVAHRITSLEPSTIMVSHNDYGFELRTDEPLELDEDEWRQVLTTDDLEADLLTCINASQLARRRFRGVARIAGLIFSGFPGQGKSARQLQASSDLFFDVFQQFDPENLLLHQAQREVLEHVLEINRMRGALERSAARRIVIMHTDMLSPLAFPIWAERLRSEYLSTEDWSDRMQQMARRLELQADATQERRQRRKFDSQRSVKHAQALR